MTNSKLKITLTFFSMILCFSVFAQRSQGNRGRGQGPQRGGMPDAYQILSKLDINNDDVIDREEASKDKRGKIAEHFDEIDSNGDELINLEELKDSLSNKKPKKISAEKIIERIDDNGDGTLNLLEVAAKNKKTLMLEFKSIDANQDEELDLEELKTYYSQQEKKPKKRR